MQREVENKSIKPIQWHNVLTARFGEINTSIHTNKNVIYKTVIKPIMLTLLKIITVISKR